MSGEGSLFDVPPAAIGRFRVLHQVGAGASGPVFRAVHPETDAPLAIKLFTVPQAPERAQLVAADLESLVRVMPIGEGACELIEAGVHGAITPYLVTTFAPGDSLDVALKQFGPAALIDLVPRLRTLARALDVAADEDVLHGALHPRDVLVSESSTRLTGLGIWPILVRHGERLPIRRPYRAPELGEATISAAADRFALAVLAYEWMTGRRAPSAFVAGDMAPVPGADRDALAGVFARALHANPAERYTSCEAFVAELAETERDETPVPAEVPKLEARPRRRGGRAASRPALPLDVFPTQQDPDLSARDGELQMAPPDPGPAALEESQDVVVPVLDRLDDDLGSAPVAGTTWRRPPTADVATTPLLRDGGYSPLTAPPQSSSGGARLAVGLLLGLMLGIGGGYALWGRGWSLPVNLPGLSGAESGGNGSSGPSAGPVDPSASDASPSAGSAGSAQPEPQEPVAAAPPAAEPSPPSSSQPTSATPSAPPAAAVAPSGNLLVRSTPAGATVFVDDQRRGVTPLALQSVELGTRRVRIQRDGFTVEERQVTLTRSRPSRSVDVRLTRAAPATRPAPPAPAAPAARTGSLVIESRPTGATIVLNGRQVGTTPMTIDDLEPGTYTVLLQLPTYRPITTTVRVVAGARARAAASLVSVQEP